MTMKKVGPYIVIGILTVIIFVSEIFIPVNWADWFFYLIPLLLASRFFQRHTLYIYTAICSVLIYSGHFLSPHVSHPTAELINRTLTIVVVWIMMYLSVILRRTMASRDSLDKEIKERKKVEEALKFNNVLLVAQQEVSRDGIFMVDEKDRILSYNKRFVDMWNIPPEVMDTGSAESARQFVAPSLNDPEGFLNKLRSIYDNRNYMRSDELSLKDGRIFSRYTAPLTGEDGRYYGRVLYYRDITDIRKLERERADLLAMVTHDIKSPLTAILNYTDLLAEKASIFDADTNSMIASIRNSGKKLKNLVEDFLSVSQMDSGMLTLKLSASDISHILREAYLGLENAILGKRLTCKVEIAEELPAKVLVDKQLVERAVSNLIENAVKFTPSGGMIKLKAESVEEGDGKFIMISVTDTGPGISAEEHKKVFEKYFRSQKTTWSNGTGLGLAIVRAVAEAHKGRVELLSEPEKGSTFRMYLPTGL